MKTNSLKLRMLLGMFLIGISLSMPTAASHGGGGGHGGGGWHGGEGWHGGRGGPGWWGLGLGLGWETAYIGDPYFYNYYSYPYPYPYPVYEQPYPGYVQPATVPAQPPAQFWYYCASTKGYYPYVPSCTEAWQPVPALPPAPPR
jgi:hypothetical protein